MTVEQAMAWAKAPWLMKQSEPERDRLQCEALEVLHMEVLRLRIVNGAYREAVQK